MSEIPLLDEYSGFLEWRRGETVWVDSPSLVDTLEQIWREADSTGELTRDIWFSRLDRFDPEQAPEERSPAPAPSFPGWTFGVTPTFKRTVRKADKKLQGRVLSAVVDLTENPLRMKGDTIKPLQGKHQGLWRYRIGDYRLIYKPILEDQRVVLIFFGAREAAYS
jgi:mRNA-degrading endonuclease RelE of RelBE toxin-antitoxin system